MKQIAWRATAEEKNKLLFLGMHVHMYTCSTEVPEMVSANYTKEIYRKSTNFCGHYFVGSIFEGINFHKQEQPTVITVANSLYIYAHIFVDLIFVGMLARINQPPTSLWVYGIYNLIHYIELVAGQPFVTVQSIVTVKSSFRQALPFHHENRVPHCLLPQGYQLPYPPIYIRAYRVCMNK